VLALAVVLLALYIGAQVLSVLYGIVMPPQPPRPNDVLEVSHQSDAYGVDSWEYTAPGDPCAVVQFYEARGGACVVGVGLCGREGSDQLETPAAAVCSGQTPFSIFNMHWSATIFPNSADSSRLEVKREVYWIGTGPEATPQFDFGQLSSSPNAPSAP
jgi:hypothetical protein